MEDHKVVKSKHGSDVKVRHEISKTPEHLHVIEISAECGSVTVKRRVTIGAINADQKGLSTETLQMILDLHRQIAADEAAWKSQVEENIKGIA